MELAEIPKDKQGEINLPLVQNNAFVKMFFTPNRDTEVRINMKELAIWKGFPLHDRFFYSLFCGSSCYTDNKSKTFFIDQLLERKCLIDERIEFENKYLSLKILKTGTFDIEPCIIHPYVKITILNLRTGKYLQKKNFEIPVFLHNEKNLIISHNSSQNILEYKESSLDFIPPFSTKPCDLRIKGESFAEWNEELIINDSADNIFQSDNIIFFEIMDFNLFPNVYSSMRDYTTEEFIFPIAWGYLKPVGFSQTYLGKYKIQLYKYKYKSTEIMKKLKLTNSAFIRTPNVLFEFNWIKKEKYQTYLEVEINIENKPSIEDLDKEYYIRKYKNSVFISEYTNIGRDIDKNKFRRMKTKTDEIDNKLKDKRLILAKRRRAYGEDCILPDKLLYKFDTAPLGCLTQEYSPNGKFLAASCTELNSLTSIKIFNVEEGKLSFHLKGHINLIHSFSWTLDNTILISSGSDNNVIIWQIPQDDSNNTDNYDYMDNEKIFKLSNIIHPSYVYTTSILPEDSKDMIILATGCFDGVVRIYSINFVIEGTGVNNLKESEGNIKGLLSSGSNFNKSFYGKNFSNTKKTFAKYTMLAQILINEEFVNQDFFFKTQQSGFGDSTQNKNKSNYSTFMEKKNTKNSKFYDHDKRTEEYLNKMNIKKEDFNNLNDTEKNNLIEKTVLEHRHPNSIFFDELGKLYIGDSLGAVHIWEFRIINSKPICNKIRVISHKEIEGDDINKLYLESGPKRRLVIHSRDNCIRLIDISTEKPKIIVRYYGMKCSKMNIKSVVSPDAAFILSGSEDGKPYIWSLFSGTGISTGKYECDIVDYITDVSWNNCYNMFSFSGFGQNYPLLVYVHERQEIGLDQLEYKYKYEEEILMKKSEDKKEKIISAYKDNISDFSKEFKTIIEPQIKN